MNLENKKLLKSEILKGLEGNSVNEENISVLEFSASVHHLNDMIEKLVANNLMDILLLEIIVRAEHCSDDSIYFSIVNADNYMERLLKGVMAPVSNEDGVTVLEDESKTNGRLGELSIVYEKIMEQYKAMNVPITDNVSFGYDFAHGYYLQLLNNPVKVIYDKDSCEDTDTEYYYSWEDFEEVIKSVVIPVSYKEKLDFLIKKVEAIINEYDSTKTMRHPTYEEYRQEKISWLRRV